MRTFLIPNKFKLFLTAAILAGIWITDKASDFITENILTIISPTLSSILNSVKASVMSAKDGPGGYSIFTAGVFIAFSDIFLYSLTAYLLSCISELLARREFKTESKVSDASGI